MTPKKQTNTSRAEIIEKRSIQNHLLKEEREGMKMTRIYIFTGKGGVGKSSVAAAHAIKSAKEGKKSILMSTDMAHNLGDIFCKELGKEPVSVMENLDLYEVDPNHIMETEYGEIMNCMKEMIPTNPDINMEDYGMFPGTEELFALLKVIDLYESNQYDRIFIDCAPTGETLSLLKFPELLSWYMEKFFPLGKVAMRVLSPVSKQLFAVQLPNKVAMNDIEKLYLRLQDLQNLLKNEEVTSIRLVTIPEKMVVEETKRNYMYMNLYHFHVDGVYINRVLPENLENTYFTEWLQIQKKYKEELRNCFAQLPMYEIPWYDAELKGTAAIEKMAKDALQERHIFDKIVDTPKEMFTSNDKGYVLTVYIPCAEKKDLDLFQSNTDLIIRLNQFKRSIPLPNVLREYQVTGANFEEDSLKIQFEAE